jgi:Zn finger protein HypA/HybF involved in hydrogenase expression
MSAFGYSDPADWDEIEASVDAECYNCTWTGELDVTVGCRPNTSEGVYTYVCPQCGSKEEGEMDL